MAAPVANKVILPSDTGNTGKNVRTQTRVVGADTVHEHFFIPISARKITTVGYFNSGAVKAVVNAAENGTTTGTFWLQNPAAATVKVRIRRLEVVQGWTVATALDMLTNPRIAFQRFTFTGTPSGATLTVTKRDTADSAFISDVRTANTGMTVTLVGDALWAATIQGVDVTTSGITPYGPAQIWQPAFEDDFLILTGGEGIVCYQKDAATASDQRSYRVNVSFDEYDNA